MDDYHIRHCVMCADMILLTDGYEWPKRTEATLCWSCQDAEIDRLREVLEIYADKKRWLLFTPDDSRDGWRAAQDALVCPWSNETRLPENGITGVADRQG